VVLCVKVRVDVDTCKLVRRLSCKVAVVFINWSAYRVQS
jgi:hypothetical protein